jgi:GDP-mannose transporter
MCGLPAPVLAGIAYCTASASMVLLNKFALSSFDFRSITMLLLFQCVFCVVAVYTSSLLGIIKLEVSNALASRVGCCRSCPTSDF